MKITPVRFQAITSAEKRQNALWAQGTLPVKEAAVAWPYSAKVSKMPVGQNIGIDFSLTEPGAKRNTDLPDFRVTLKPDANVVFTGFVVPGHTTTDYSKLAARVSEPAIAEAKELLGRFNQN